MTLSDLLAELDAWGVSLVRDGDQLRCEGKGEFPPGLLQELKAHRAELLESLSRCGWCKGPLPPARDCWRVLHDAGVSYLCSATCAFKAWPWKVPNAEH